MTHLFLSSETISQHTDLAKQFKSFMNETFINHRGCIVEKTKNGFIVYGKEVKTMAGVDQLIDNSIQSLGNSLKR